MKCWVFLLFMTSLACSSGPGLTPMEQDGLETLDAPLEAPILFTQDEAGNAAVTLLAVFEEFKKTPLVLHIVWRTPQAPRTGDFAQFPGKRIKQYWDPKGLTPSTKGQVRVLGKLVEEELLSLRLAFARAAALP